MWQGNAFKQQHKGTCLRLLQTATWTTIQILNHPHLFPQFNVSVTLSKQKGTLMILINLEVVTNFFPVEY